MEWILLILGGIFEIAWAVGLKYTDGFTKTNASIFTVITMLFSFWLQSLAMKTLPLGLSYAVWTGIGIIGTVIFGIIWLEESASAPRLGFILLILVGILGLKLT